MRSVIITGGRCVGKTTIGKKVSELLGIPFLDTDEVLTLNYGKVSDIVENEGWTAFRRYENSVLKDLTAKIKETVVLSPGGGAVAHSENVQGYDPDYDELNSLRKSNVSLLRNFGTNYFLQQHKNVKLAAKIQTERMLSGNEPDGQRPPLTECDDKYQEMLAVMGKRLPFYRAAADVIVVRNDMDQKETAEYIASIHPK